MRRRSKYKRSAIKRAQEQSGANQPASAPVLNLDYMNASSVVTVDHLRIQIIVAGARRDLHEALGHNPERVGPHDLPKIWWLDCGNLKDTGRVLLGSAYTDEQCAGAFVEKKKCIALPSPALQYPGLLIPQRDERRDREMSCAELQMANLQSLNINAGIAVQAADMLTRLLVTRDLKRYQCAVNLASGSVKSFYCTPENISREIGRPRDFVIRPGAPVEAAA